MRDIIAYEIPGQIVTTESCNKCKETTKHFITSLKTEQGKNGYKIVYTMSCTVCKSEKQVEGSQIKV